MCQTVWIQIRSVVLSRLIWIQTVCKGYQQTTKLPPVKKEIIPVGVSKILPEERQTV